MLYDIRIEACDVNQLLLHVRGKRLEEETKTLLQVDFACIRRLREAYSQLHVHNDELALLCAVCVLSPSKALLKLSAPRLLHVCVEIRGSISFLCVHLG